MRKSDAAPETLGDGRGLGRPTVAPSRRDRLAYRHRACRLTATGRRASQSTSHSASCGSHR
eukprot:5230680-Pyramimonas_sp.AAC.1